MEQSKAFHGLHSEKSLSHFGVGNYVEFRTIEVDDFSDDNGVYIYEVYVGCDRAF